MLRRRFGKTGWDVGVIGFGAWGIGGQWGAVQKRQALDAIDAALDAGMNLIDVADAYGEPSGTSERLVAEALRGRRDKLYIATKVGNFARRQAHPLPFTHWLHVDLCCDASLHRLRTDYIDLYQCHIGGCDQPGVFLEAFDRLIDAGKVRAFGISTNRLDVAEAFNRDGKCAAVQLEYSYLNRAAEDELLPYCREHDIATLIRGPLQKGVATGKFTADSTFTDSVRQRWNEGEHRQRFLAQLEVVERVREAAGVDPLTETALRFVISHPAVTVAIPGAKDAEQARQNARAGRATLDDTVLEAIRQVTDTGVTR